MLRINEFMASNAWTIADDDGLYSDWIEIYNPHYEDLSLANLSITDTIDEPDKVILGDIIVPAGGFVLLWAIGTECSEESESCVGFKLSKGGEFMGLFDKRDNPIDTLEYGPQATDFSAGRLTDGGAEWTIMENPTPGDSNE